MLYYALSHFSSAHTCTHTCAHTHTKPYEVALNFLSSLSFLPLFLLSFSIPPSLPPFPFFLSFLSTKLRPRRIKKYCPSQPGLKRFSKSKIFQDIYMALKCTPSCFWEKFMGWESWKVLVKIWWPSAQQSTGENIPGKPENSSNPVLFRFYIWAEPHSLPPSTPVLCLYWHSSAPLSSPLLRSLPRDSPSNGNRQLCPFSLGPSSILIQLSSCKSRYQVELQV